MKDQDRIAIGNYLLKFISSDSSEQTYYQEVYRQAYMDRVLQIYNKHYFLLRMEEELSRVRRNKSVLSLLMFDVDHFKVLNDVHGHLAGDAALLHLAGLVNKHTRRIDALCRYGGEEFALILPDTDRHQALVIAEHIRILIAEHPCHYAGKMMPLTVSLGVASYTADIAGCTGNCEQLVEWADSALYQAKQSGRNRVVTYDSGTAS